MQQSRNEQGLLEDLFPPTYLTLNHYEDDLLPFPASSYSSIFTNPSSFLQPTFQSLNLQSIYTFDTSFNASISSSLYNQQDFKTLMAEEEDDDDDNDDEDHDHEHIHKIHENKKNVVYDHDHEHIHKIHENKKNVVYDHDHEHIHKIHENKKNVVSDHDHEHIHKIHENKKNVVSDHDQIPSVFSMGWNGEKKSKSKRVEGQPSKNLMAERRRRKRLNDRLSMLRSIVPKISKMDRTSILGDTIDYMKELMGKIHDLKEQDMDGSKLVGGFKEFTMNEVQVRNPPKFDVARENTDTRIEICCSTKPGLVLSTMTTLEALGLDIQHCVISCFNDFSLQASCYEGLEHESMTSCEDMKQILFKNAGYGGRCL